MPFGLGNVWGQTKSVGQCAGDSGPRVLRFVEEIDEGVADHFGLKLGNPYDRRTEGAVRQVSLLTLIERARPDALWMALREQRSTSRQICIRR